MTAAIWQSGTKTLLAVFLRLQGISFFILFLHGCTVIELTNKIMAILVLWEVDMATGKLCYCFFLS